MLNEAILLPMWFPAISSKCSKKHFYCRLMISASQSRSKVMMRSSVSRAPSRDPVSMPWLWFKEKVVESRVATPNHRISENRKLDTQIMVSLCLRYLFSRSYKSYFINHFIFVFVLSKQIIIIYIGWLCSFQWWWLLNFTWSEWSHRNSMNYCSHEL